MRRQREKRKSEMKEKENLRKGDRKQETRREQGDSCFMLAQRNYLKFEYQMKRFINMAF